MNDIHTLADAARTLGIDPSVLRHARIKGRLTATRFGSQWVITTDEMNRYADEQLGKKGRKKLS